MVSRLRLTFTIEAQGRSAFPPINHSSNMKHLLLSAIAALFLSYGSLYAQAPTNAGLQQVEDPALQEMRVVAGSLKELFGELNDQLRVVTKLSETTDRIAAKRIVEIQGEIKEDLATVERGLDRMSGLEAKAWAGAKEEVMEIERTMRTSVAARTKGLSEAYGDSTNSQ